MFVWAVSVEGAPRKSRAAAAGAFLRRNGRRHDWQPRGAEGTVALPGANSGRRSNQAQEIGETIPCPFADQTRK